MGKGEKTGLGRALVKHHRHMIIESNEKGQFYRRQSKKVLESVTDVNDIDAVIGDADEKDRLYSSQYSNVKVLDLDSASEASKVAPEDLREQQMEEEALHASSLRVPRRPPWNSQMTVEELDSNERRAFLSWRRSLAKLEENEKLVLTPFEKNLDIWRQLWRVVERSDLLVTVVDARNPLFYRCPDLEDYVREVDEHKKTMLLINKADLLPCSVREKWANYFRLHGILYLFWSAKAATAATAALEGKELIMLEESADADTKIYGREELLARLQSEAEKIVSMRGRPGSSMSGEANSDSDSDDSGGDTASVKSVMVGFVGYPNVGKSSTINALVGEKRTGVTSTPGKTKHFQTLIISDRLTLCDCPGLVFPSLTSSRYEMIASGVLPIDRMTEHREAVQVAANRVPREVFENVYRISLPKPKSYEPQSRPPTAAELLRTYCASRGYVSSRGLPDETKASRQILKDYIDGKLTHFQMPPGISDDKAESEYAAQPILSEEVDPDSSGDEHPSDNEIDTPDLEHVLDDLDSFDIANGLVPGKELIKKKPPRAPHKQHKKPQRKKDRTWRVQNAEGDGMPVVRVYQKPTNTGPSNP